MFDTGKIYAFWNMTKGIRDALIGTIQNAINFTETTNKFEVSMGNMKNAAYKFINATSEQFGLAKEELMNYQSTYNNIMKSLSGVTNETAYRVSESLTKMAIDYASLFNVSVGSSMTKFQAALTGQIKPIRSDSGYDISEKTLATKAKDLGVTTSVKSLSEMDKRLLRIIALMEQLRATGAMGDFAKTIEQPSNQLKILSNQLKELSTWIGNVFLGTIGKILPYVNGFVMALKEIVKTLAFLVGYENTGSVADPLEEADEYSSNTATNLGTAAKNAKELKKQLYGFDVLNVQQTPTSTSGGTSGASTGVTPEILAALKDYDNLMSNVRMKATDIRDKILEWLGFTYDLNDEGQITNLKLGKGLTNLKKIEIVVKGILALFAIKKITKWIGTVKGAVSSIIGLFSKKSVDAGLSGGSASSFKIPSVTETLKALADLAIIIGGVIALVGVIGAFTQIPVVAYVITTGMNTLKEVFGGITLLLPSMAGLSAIAVILGKIGVATVAKGFADLAIIIGGTSVLITAIGAFVSIPYFGSFLNTGIESVTKVFKGLQEIMLPLVEVSALMLVLGLATPATMLSGLVGFAIIIGGVETVVIALGALTEIMEQLNLTKLADKGFVSLNKIATAIGEFAGNLLGGFVEATFSSIEGIGTSLSNFMINATPFMEGVNNINAESAKGAKYLAEMLLDLTSAQIITGLTSWLVGEASLEDFGRQLAAFAPYYKKYATTVKNVDAKVVTASANAAKALAEFANNLPKQGGMKDWFIGTSSIDKFGTVLPGFGANLKKYSDNVSGINSDIITASANAAKTLAEFANNLPNKGGIVSWFTGDNTLEDFSKVLPEFGTNLKKYSNNVSGLKSEAVTASANAAKAISELARNLPNSGGLVALFTGDNSIDAFGKKLATFGEYFFKYYKNIKDIAISKINIVTDSVKTLISAFVTVKDKGLTNTVKDFGSNLSSAGKNLVKFYSQAFTKKEGKTIGETFGTGIGAGVISKVKESFPLSLQLSSGNTQLKTFSITARKFGGFPSIGEMFIAREAGPELVGTIGSKSAVVNNEQIVEAVSRGVAQAVAGVMGSNNGGEYNLYIDGQQITDIVTKRMNRMANITGGGYAYGQ